jgi:hypothetical protein
MVRGALWIASSAALAISLAACPRTLAAAEGVTVIRGSEVTVVGGREGFAREARRAVGPTPPRHRGSDPSPPARVDSIPQVVVVFVDARANPEIAWELINPWEGRGIAVRGRREPSLIVIHTGPRSGVSRMRRYGAIGQRANPFVIRTPGPGGDGSNIKLDRMASRQRSRIRVHSVSSAGARVF